ncbi:MAG: hypothetical protein KGM96_01570 [Acidobacteriota bacterium]|nr:hypothetical protein [Acidobacteriota bacterium]
MRIQRCLALGLAGLSLALCFGVSLAWAGDRAAAATDPLSNINRLPAALERTVGLLRTDLNANGFAVARGYWTLWGVNDCKYPLQSVGYCYGNNPTAPYVLAVVPTWKDEYVEQKFHHLLNESLRNMNAIHRLDQREALVVVAQLPPEARYFGIGSNVFTREAAFDPNTTTDPIYPKVTDPLLRSILFGASPDPSRRMMVASIGNSTNNAVIEKQTGETPWSRPAYFVITSDADMEAEMINALEHAGASSSDIFTEPVAPELVKLGLDRSADDLITYIRYSMPVDKVAGEQWRQTLPLTILRVRDVSSRRYDNPLPIPAYGLRTANYDENQLTSDFAALRDAVIANWGQQTQATVAPFFSGYKYLDLIGQHCLGYPDPTRGPMDCLGDSPDADYQISASAQIDDGQVIAVVGTLSKETGNALYTSLSVNWFPELVGVANIDDTELKGSASGIPGAPSNSDLFYVYYVARDCTGLTHCIEIPTKLVPAGEIIKFIQRNYINPGSVSGPDPAKILNPVTIVLDGRNRP